MARERQPCRERQQLQSRSVPLSASQGKEEMNDIARKHGPRCLRQQPLLSFTWLRGGGEEALYLGGAGRR